MHDKAFNTAKNRKYDRYQRDVISMVYPFFDKTSANTCAPWKTLTVETKIVRSSIKWICYIVKWNKWNMSNRELAEELHKTINIKFEKWKVLSSFIDNIWGADVADRQ